jgi:hypothetical protein
MNEDKQERFFCKDENDRDLFYLELFFDYELETIFWNLSIDISLFLTEEAEDIINQIVIIDAPTEKRLILIDNLFEILKQLPEIENYFFSDELLDKNGTYSKDTADTLNNILLNKDFPDYTPFAEHSNTYYFYFFIPFLKSVIKENEITFVKRKEFELLVKNRFDLQAQYAEEYSNNAVFICIKLFNNDTQYNCYVLTIDNSIKLFFMETAC